jgi:hypothetical protein
MPRVATRTRTRTHLKHPMVCRACEQPIHVGDAYYVWKRRLIGLQYQHVECGEPSEAELTRPAH